MLHSISQVYLAYEPWILGAGLFSVVIFITETISDKLNRR
jgi:hypothetical protein